MSQECRRKRPSAFRADPDVGHDHRTGNESAGSDGWGTCRYATSATDKFSAQLELNFSIGPGAIRADAGWFARWTMMGLGAIGPPLSWWRCREVPGPAATADERSSLTN